MNIKRILLSLSMLLAATTGLMAQTTDEKGNDLDSVYAQKLLKPGTTAPDFILPMPNGYRVQLAEFKGKYVLLDFWASWCPDCRKDIPAVKAMYEKYGKNVVFIGVSFDTDRDRWAKCVADNGMTWRQVSELKKMREAKIAQTYGVQWIPSMTLVGPDGKVVLSTVVLERMEKALENL
ncbi:TlpA disulfide reductase family protein [uncultured Prevotella sp.]|uniref:TlpA family protein disulfide reductase n=1 Tax=uncultured Prevotella sp. TaxID=159272 RepID=UPI00262B20A5|nr:TlpA disulfide reductase family protein [uncultured Prevotella sp.]